jgi:hypothetical protein
MDESLFSALRIVALALGVDGKIDPKAGAWFLSLLETYGLTSSQKEVLHSDLRGQGNIDEIYSHIWRPRDRERLLNWLHVSMQLESGLHPKANKIYELVKELNRTSSPESPISYAALAEAFLEEEKNKELWIELEEAGRFFSQKMRFGTAGEMYFQLLKGTTSSNPIIIWTIIVFFLVVAFIKVAIKTWYH